MNIGAIKLFILTYQHKNFASVAKQLNVAPSSVSRAVAGLEKELQTRLFQRNTRTLTPTQSGIQYFQKVQPLLDELDSVHQSLLSGAEEPSGLVRLSASTAYGSAVLPDLTNRFCMRHPKISLDLQLNDARVDLIENQIDIAIRHGSLSDSTLVARKLRNVKYYLVASPEYLRNSNAIEKPSDINKHQIISFPYSEFAAQWHFHKGEHSQSVAVQPFLTISNAAAIKECVLRNMGLSLLADWTVSHDVDKKNLVKVLPEWNISGEHKMPAIWLVQPTRAFVPRPVQALIDFFISNRTEYLG
jgi:DNA-binding transcriptional LysR family regulator